jgi:hypothetical protein
MPLRHRVWYHPLVQTEQKITVHVRRDLLAKARKATKGGITETVLRGLEILAARDAYEGLRKLRGKVKFSVDLNELRKDKR